MLSIAHANEGEEIKKQPLNFVRMPNLKIQVLNELYAAAVATKAEITGNKIHNAFLRIGDR